MPGRAKEEIQDAAVASFLACLQAEVGASPYTQRNYRQALLEFGKWFEVECKRTPEVVTRIPPSEFTSSRVHEFASSLVHEFMSSEFTSSRVHELRDRELRVHVFRVTSS